MSADKKKIKKKELLRRIEDLELKLNVLRDKVSSMSAQPQVLISPDTLLTRPIITCSQCGNGSGGTCMNVNCPGSLKITC